MPNPAILVTPAYYANLQAIILSDGPKAYWPFNESSGSTFKNLISGGPSISALNYLNVITNGSISSALRSYYRLGEGASSTSAADIGPAGLIGTYTNNPTLGVAGALTGDSNTAMELTGTTQLLSTPPDLNITVGYQVAVEAWIKTTGTTGLTIFEMPGHISPTIDGFTVTVNSSGNIVIIETGTIGSGAYNDGNWHHVFVNSLSAPAIVVDGVVDYAGGAGLVPSYIIANRIIGQTLGAGNSFIDEVAFYASLTSAIPSAVSGLHYAVGKAGQVLSASGGSIFTFIDHSQNSCNVGLGCVTPSSAIAVTGDFTLECIIKITNYLKPIYILSQRRAFTSLTHTGMYELSLQTDGSIILSRGNGTFDQSYKSKAGIITQGKPHHIVVTHDSTAYTCNVYVDGTLVSSGTLHPSVLGDSGDPVYFGYSTGDTANIALTSPAVMSDLALYSKVLTSQQVANHYKALRPTISRYSDAPGGFF